MPYLARWLSMTVQASSASASVLKGEPPIVMALIRAPPRRLRNRAWMRWRDPPAKLRARGPNPHQRAS